MTPASNPQQSTEAAVTNLPANNSTPRTANMPVALAQAKSESLTQAIHSPNDDGFTVERARVCLKLYYDPDMDAQDRADMLNLFAKALQQYPKWAVARGFDDWEKTGTRRPSPAEIGILAGRAVKEITDELAKRRVNSAPPPKERQPVDAAEAERIMQRAGFTAKRMEAVRRSPMANTFADAEAVFDAPRKPHWTETADPDGPDMAQLRAARAANPLIQAALASQAKKDANP